MALEDLTVGQFIDLDTPDLAGLILEYLKQTNLNRINYHPNNLAIHIANGFGGKREGEVKTRVMAACRWLLNNDYLEETNSQGFFQLSRKGKTAKLERERPSSETQPTPTEDTQRSRMSNLDVFISHSSKDVDVAEALIDLLRASLNIPSERIRCTSVPGYKLRGGASTDDTLRREVHDTGVLIGIITGASLNSAYVLFELGARWGAGRYMVPLLACGLDSGVLRGPLTGINALRSYEVADVHQLLGDVAEELHLPRPYAPGYQKPLDALIAISKTAEEKASAVTDARLSSEQELSVEEADLLIKAEAGGGEILFISIDQGDWVRAGGHDFYDESDRAVAATYIDALNSLQGQGLARHTGGQLYELTGRGFTTARKLKQQQSSVTFEPKGEGQRPAARKLRAVIKHTPEKFYEGTEEHSFIVGLVNNSEKTITDFRAEIVMPNAFLNQNTHYGPEVQDRRTDETRFFRITNKTHGIQSLYPEDKIPRAFVNTLIVQPSMKGTDVMKKKLTVTVFDGGERSDKVEMTVEEFLSLPYDYS